MQLKLIAPLAILAASLATACGRQESVNAYQSSGGSTAKKPATEQDNGDATAQTGGKRDHVVRPPQEYYDALFANALRMVDAPQGLALLDATAAQTLWVNFDGASVHKGFDAGESFLLCQNLADVPGAEVSPADKDAVLAKVQKFFADAGANLNVVAEQPSSGAFTTIHVGGSFADLGCAGSGVLGIAPFDQGNANKADVGFAFTKGIDSVETIAETIAHEAGHTFGLDHTTDTKDIMYASSTDEITGFLAAALATGGAMQDGPAVLKGVLGALDGAVKAVATSAAAATAIPGLTYLPVALANVPGLAQIAMIGQLLATLKAGSTVADITALIPQIIALFPAAASKVDLSGLDKILTIVGLAASAQAQQSGQALPTSLAGVLNSNLLASILNPKNPAAISSIASLATLGGFGSIGTAISAVSGILGIFTGQQQPVTTAPATASAPAATAPAQLPDFGAILGLGAKDKNPAVIINNLLMTAEIITKNFTGVDKDALLSLLKVAYSQLYAEIQKLPATNAP